MSPRMPDYDELRQREARANTAAPVPCPECNIKGDHTWWCAIAPATLPDGRRPYYWRD